MYCIYLNKMGIYDRRYCALDCIAILDYRQEKHLHTFIYIYMYCCCQLLDLFMLFYILKVAHIQTSRNPTEMENFLHMHRTQCGRPVGPFKPT